MMGEEGKERVRSVLVSSYTERADTELLLLLTLSWRKVVRARGSRRTLTWISREGEPSSRGTRGECAHKITCSQPPQRRVWGF